MDDRSEERELLLGRRDVPSSYTTPQERVLQGRGEARDEREVCLEEIRRRQALLGRVEEDEAVEISKLVKDDWVRRFRQREDLQVAPLPSGWAQTVMSEGATEGPLVEEAVSQTCDSIVTHLRNDANSHADWFLQSTAKSLRDLPEEHPLNQRFFRLSEDLADDHNLSEYLRCLAHDTLVWSDQATSQQTVEARYNAWRQEALRVVRDVFISTVRGALPSVGTLKEMMEEATLQSVVKVWQSEWSDGDQREQVDSEKLLEALREHRRAFEQGLPRRRV